MPRITLNVNGRAHAVQVGDDDLLLDVLREQVGITSTREGCGVGACGACTVLVDGHSVSSCLARAVRYDGRSIQTADGLPADDDVVDAFVECGAMQCGYCIPGFVLMTHELLDENAGQDVDASRVNAHLEGNLCRCGSYPQIAQAVEMVACRRAAASRHGS
jgi:aerobic-type carbon monoxide dehydrogenase small subunit (CoxS/CutS family)